MPVEMLEISRPAPALPAGVPVAVRCLCYAFRQIRGYGRFLPFFARRFSSLQQVTIDSFFAGPLSLDLRELICLPLFVFGYYKHQFAEDRLLHHLVRPGMRIFDIGANIGYYMGVFSQRVGQRGLVVSVEPMPRALRLLRETASFCGPSAKVVEAAIGSHPGQANLHEQQHLDTSWVSFNGGKAGHTIPVLTIDQLADQFGVPHILKIDVEGAELEAVRGAQKTIADSTPPIVMIEYIPGNAAQFGGYSLDDLLKFFPRDSFRVYRVLHSGRLIEANAVHAEGSTNDYLAVPLSRASEVERWVCGSAA